MENCLHGHKATCFSQPYKNYMQQNAHALCPALIHHVDSSVTTKHCLNGKPLKSCCPRDNLNIKSLCVHHKYTNKAFVLSSSECRAWITGAESDPDGLVQWKGKQTPVKTSSSPLLPGWVSKISPELGDVDPFSVWQMNWREKCSVRRLSD